VVSARARAREAERDTPREILQLKFERKENVASSCVLHLAFQHQAGISLRKGKRKGLHSPIYVTRVTWATAGRKIEAR
jgi:hypothetical protein